ncbi:MAG: gamma-glutamyltransferase [Actinomycetota bacterium]|nr:gamma-glutamyltransferase [Actinomycetota bacterium]
MKGAIAAGHPSTAEAGARVLAEGGNAVDACIAAAFVSWVTESPLTGPGAGGFMLVHRARDRRDRVLDFFAATPGRGLEEEVGAGEMQSVDIAFDARNVQRFFVGAAACAVPGTVAGLAEAHRLYATLPWSELVAPAVELAREGVELTPAQALLHSLLAPILRLRAEGRRVYGADGAIAAGARIPMDELAATLAQLAEEGPDAFYRGDLARRVAAHVRELGGLITEDDLAGYRVVGRGPVRAAFRDSEFVSNPPPSSGGVLIAFALRVLDRAGPPRDAGTEAAIALLAEVMREAAAARRAPFPSSLYRGGLAARLLGDAAVDEAALRVRRACRVSARDAVGLPSTTHVSVVDAAGNAASLSASTGSGSGVVVPGTGIHLNNMLGEEDLNPARVRARPGRRLTSMMSPSLVLADGRPRLVVGSAGSVRLRAAILQIVVNVVDHGMGVEEAIAAPRVHLEEKRLHVEGGVRPEVADALEGLDYDVVRWGDINPFFGGASAVALRADGELEAAGDPRRGGAGLVVA